MSVVFLVRSEEQLRSGTPWCVVFSESIDAAIVPIVVANEPKILEKHAESVLNDAIPSASQQAAGEKSRSEKVDVLVCEPDIEAVLNQCRSVRCKLLVIIHSIDQDEWQQELFEKSDYQTVWLCPAAHPPVDEAHIIGGFLDSETSTRRQTQKLLGMLPGSWALDRLGDEIKANAEQHIEAARTRFDEQASHPESLVIVTVESTSKSDLQYAVGLRLLDHDYGTSVALVRDGSSVARGMLNSFRRWTESITPPLTRSERIELQRDLESGSLPSFEFLGLISASSMLAAFGLLQNSAAVIIGAMLIAPLMTPILGAGMAIAIGNKPLFKSAITAISVGFIGALVSSALFGLLIRALQEPDLSPDRATEMWARCHPSAIDFCVGLVGGMAAAYARTRTYLSSALAGAAIAAALVPPISTAGLQIAFGIWQVNQAGRPVFGPLIVVSINVITIMIGSSIVLWLRGIRARAEIRKQDRWAVRAFVMLVVVGLVVLAALI